MYTYVTTKYRYWKSFVYRLEVEKLCWLLGFWWQYLDVLESSLL